MIRTLIRIQVTEERGKSLAYVSSLTVALVSLFGLRPGFGFAGITHSFEAKGVAKAKDKGRERETTTHVNTYGRPITLKRKTLHLS